MLKIIQNTPTIFQSEDTKTFNKISGYFYIKNNKNIITIDNNIIKIDDIIYNIYNDNKHIGGNIWLSSLALILNLNKNIFNNKKILELGAGVGLLSMYISNISKSSIINASDYDISITNYNILQNKFNNYNNISINKIDWYNLDDNDNEKYDIIIACDCVYRTTYKSLLETIKKYLKPYGKLFISNADRENVDEFIYGLQEFDENIKVVKERLYYNDKYYIDINIIH